MALKVYYPKSLIKKLADWLISYFKLKGFWGIVLRLGITVLVMVAGAFLENSTGWVLDLWQAIKDIIENLGSGVPVPAIFLI
jgi:hypothetical protein